MVIELKEIRGRYSAEADFGGKWNPIDHCGGLLDVAFSAKDLANQSKQSSEVMSIERAS